MIIFNALVMLLLSILFVQMVIIFAKKPLSVSRYIVSIAAIWLVAFGVTHFLVAIPLLNIIGIYAGYFICATLITKVRWRAVLMATTIHSMCALTAEILGSYVAIYLKLDFSNSTGACHLMGLSRFLFGVLLILALFTIRRTIKNAPFRQYTLDNSDFMRSLIIINALLFLNRLLIVRWSESKIDMSVLLVFTPVMFFGITMYAIYGRYSYLRQSQQQTELAHYYMSLSQSAEELRKFSHDYRNILISLSGYAANQQWGPLVAYIEELAEIIEIKDVTGLNCLANIRDPSMISLLGNKMWKADEVGVGIEIMAPRPVDIIPIKAVDFTRVLGTFLDNAIEAALETDDKKVVIEFSTFGGTYEVGVYNSIADTTIDIDILNKYGYSTKGLGRGMGLHNVHTILANYENVEWLSYVEGNTFIQRLMVNVTEDS